MLGLRVRERVELVQNWGSRPLPEFIVVPNAIMDDIPVLLPLSEIVINRSAEIHRADVAEKQGF